MTDVQVKAHRLVAAITAYKQHAWPDIGCTAHPGACCEGGDMHAMTADQAMVHRLERAMYAYLNA